MFANKVLLAQGPFINMPSLVAFGSQVIWAEINRCDRDHLACKAENSYSLSLYRKSLRPLSYFEQHWAQNELGLGMLAIIKYEIHTKVTCYFFPCERCISPTPLTILGSLSYSPIL